MFEILAKEDLAPVTKLFVISAPDVAAKAKPGQFVMVLLDDEGERIPLTIADSDPEAGTITIICQEVGRTTVQMGKMRKGDRLRDFVGPLGTPTHIEKVGTVVCVAGGLGIAEIFPIARAMREAGNRVISIIGARTADLLFWEDRMRQVSDDLIVTTDDGSYGRKALVTVPLKEILDGDQKVDLVMAVGPAIMMKFVSKTTEPYGVPTIVSINSIMVDGTGMCGSCRIQVGGETKFVCVDGPDFDGHQVDWDLLMARQRIYLGEEKACLEDYNKKCAKCESAA